jgi:soluble lytic murein transglycosylase-like protein
VDPCAAADGPLPGAISFAYANSHPVTPLPAAVIHRIVNTDGRDSDEADAFDEPHDARVDVRVGRPPALSRNGMCGAVVSVARANDLPIPFFANLIWQESSFNTRTISSAGAFGVAQFMPQTANEYGLINPFEPIHALHAAGRFLRKLNGQFGNLGLAAAAYNAGPRRVSDWMAKRGGLPNETRNYVIRITGRVAEQWTSSEFVRDPESTLMPAKAPCAEVAEEVAAQGKIVRVSKLMSELAAATKAPRRDNPNEPKFDEAAWTIASTKPEWRLYALNVVRGALKNISEQRAREAAAKKSIELAGKMASKAGRAWSRIADRTMRKAAEEFAKASVDKAAEKADKPVTARGRGISRRTHVALAR